MISMSLPIALTAPVPGFHMAMTVCDCFGGPPDRTRIPRPTPMLPQLGTYRRAERRLAFSAVAAPG